MKYALYRYSKSWFIWLIYIVCIYLILLATFADGPPDSDGTTMIIASVTIMVLLTGRMYFSMRKAYKTNPFSGTEINWTISEAGVTYKQGSAAGEMGWDRIDKITESKNWMMIWFNKKILFYFQKNNLSASQLADFKKLLQRVGKGYFRY